MMLNKTNKLRRRKMKNRINSSLYIGKKINCVTIVYEIKDANRSMVWGICECGVEKEFQISKLLRDEIKSCGCLKIMATHSITHGLSKHPLYNVWVGMRRRCYDETKDNYATYGGRGIAVCDLWKNDFKPFYEWAILNGWKKGLEIDRFPNNDGNYEPSNCRITTPENNKNNTRRNVFYDIEGESLTLPQISKRFNMGLICLQQRIRLGWDIYRAISTPKETKFLRKSNATNYIIA